MKDLAQYKITFPYGATSPPYSSTRPHRGDDRACPIGTPILIGSTNVALTGNTGLSTGPHCHVQEWQNLKSNTRKPQNAFKGGLVYEVKTAADLGNYVTIRAEDGWNTTYAHLSKINVTKGQTVGMSADKVSREELIEIHRGFLMSEPGPAFLDAYTGARLQDVLHALDYPPNTFRMNFELTHVNGQLGLTMKPLDEGVVVFETLLDKTEVWDLATGPVKGKYESRFTYKKGEQFQAVAFIDTNGTRYYVSAPDALRGRAWGVNARDVKAIDKFKPIKPPSNLKQLDKGLYEVK